MSQPKLSGKIKASELFGNAEERDYMYRVVKMYEGKIIKLEPRKTCGKPCGKDVNIYTKGIKHEKRKGL